MDDLIGLWLKARQRLEHLHELPVVLRQRGLSFQDAVGLELGLDETGNLLIPIRDHDKNLIGLKGRYVTPGTRKYFEIPEANNNPPWLAPTVSGATRGLLFIEGELNAMVSYLSLQAEGYGVIGLGSAFAELPAWATRAALPIFLYLDNDIASNKSAKTFLEQAKQQGLQTRRLEGLLGSFDACEYAEMCGLQALKERWLQLLS